ncbi:proline-, glutamic acid- and leucine-rich protein 1-like [Euwallacea fornicatus]|uniref:proline-, glutamic acid- and leucine-rich protein 1-like n=1 Tax=Euwallacea fornicatus TaxID=995702 RepID=UPI00338FF1B5
MPLSTSHIEGLFTSKQDGIKKLLSSILNLNLSHEENEKSIVNIINKLLSTAKHRKEGLEYLNLIISRCSTFTIAENSLNWINHCIIKFSDDVLRELKMRLIGKIIKASYNDSDFNKRFITEHVSKVLDNCLTTSHVSPYQCAAALKTLTTAMIYYPSWFGVHSQKIEMFILIFLDSPHTELVNNAALAFHYLQQIGGAGIHGANYKANFTRNLHKLCKTAHNLYDKLCANYTQLFSNIEPLEGDSFEFDEETVLDVTVRRIFNVFKFIETMIKTGFPVAKESSPKVLLGTVSRFLEYHKCISSSNEESLESYQFSLQLQTVQSYALKLFRLFIIWYQSDFLPFSYSISKSIVESIERVRSCECYKSDSLYQESAFKALSEWLTVSKSSLHPQFQSRLLETILPLIILEKTEATLTISIDNVSSKKSEKAKRRAMTNRIISSGNKSSGLPSDQKQSSSVSTCKYALEALRRILECSKLNIKSTLLKDLYKSIFTSLISIQSGQLLPPYNNPENQIKLYKLLSALYSQNTLSILPPLHTTLDILNVGANDRNHFIAATCQECLRVLESFCQPICPSLYMGIEKEGVVEEEEEVIEASESGSAGLVESIENVSVDDQHSDGCSDKTSYQVRFTESDWSTIDDGLSEKGARCEDFKFQEVGDEEAKKINDNLNVFENPVVTAPSEDGNEVLEGEFHHNVSLGSIEEDPDDDGEANGEEDTETSPKNQNTIELPKSFETTISQVSEEIKDVMGASEETVLPQVGEELLKAEEEITMGNYADTSLITENVDIGSEVVERSAKNRERDSEEPVAKKAKIIDENEVSSKNDLKGEEKDPDESYLEEDSFVDEVRDDY